MGFRLMLLPLSLSVISAIEAYFTLLLAANAWHHSWAAHYKVPKCGLSLAYWCTHVVAVAEKPCCQYYHQVCVASCKLVLNMLVQMALKCIEHSQTNDCDLRHSSKSAEKLGSFLQIVMWDMVRILCLVDLASICCSRENVIDATKMLFNSWTCSLVLHQHLQFSEYWTCSTLLRVLCKVC